MDDVCGTEYLKLRIPDELSLQKETNTDDNNDNDNRTKVFIYSDTDKQFHDKHSIECTETGSGVDSFLDEIFTKIDCDIVRETDYLYDNLDGGVPIEKSVSDGNIATTIPEKNREIEKEVLTAEDSFDHSNALSSKSSSSVDVTQSVLEKCTSANFFNLKRFLPSHFEEHELPQKKRWRGVLPTNEKSAEVLATINSFESPNECSGGIFTADLVSTLFVFQKVCSINQRQGQKIKNPAMIKLLKKSAYIEKGNIDSGVSWNTVKYSLKLKFEDASNASVKFMKKDQDKLFTSMLKKDLYENGTLIVYGRTGQHSDILEKERDKDVTCCINGGILCANFLSSPCGSCDIDALGLSVQAFASKNKPIGFPILLKDESFFKRIYTIKLVNVIRFKKQK